MVFLEMRLLSCLRVKFSLSIRLVDIFRRSIPSPKMTFLTTLVRRLPCLNFTPKHGSWLNIAEIELNVLTGQCLDRRIDNIETVKKEVAEWQKFRNNKNAKVNWQFTTADARVRLSRLYPTLDS